MASTASQVTYKMTKKPWCQFVAYMKMDAKLYIIVWFVILFVSFYNVAASIDDALWENKKVNGQSLFCYNDKWWLFYKESTTQILVFLLYNQKSDTIWSRNCLFVCFSIRFYYVDRKNFAKYTCFKFQKSCFRFLKNGIVHYIQKTKIQEFLFKKSYKLFLLMCTVQIFFFFAVSNLQKKTKQHLLIKVSRKTRALIT